MNKLHSEDLIYWNLKASNMLFDKEWNPLLKNFHTITNINRNIRNGTIGTC